MHQTNDMLWCVEVHSNMMVTSWGVTITAMKLYHKLHLFRLTFFQFEWCFVARGW